MRLAARLVKLNIFRLRRRLLLLAAMAAAFAVLSAPLGAGAENMLSRESVEPLSIAVCGEEAGLISRLAGNMADISEYCSFIEMDETEALEALGSGEVTAVLLLPDDFIGSILSGANEPALLYTDPDEPVEGMLVLYAGRSAADMLSAAQGGIYAVLDELSRQGIERPDAVMEINLEYIKFTLSRSDMYRSETVSAAGTMPVDEHYALSLMCWLMLMAAVIYHPVMRSGQGAWRSRLRSAGCSGAVWAVGAAAPVLLCSLVLTAAVCAFFGSVTAGGIVSCAVFTAGFSALLCALCPEEGTASAVIFAASCALTFLAGGIIPPALMPEELAWLVDSSPVGAMRLAITGEGSWLLAALGAVMLAAAGALCAGSYAREAER